MAKIRIAAAATAIIAAIFLIIFVGCPGTTGGDGNGGGNSGGDNGNNNPLIGTWQRQTSDGVVKLEIDNYRLSTILPPVPFIGSISVTCNYTYTSDTITLTNCRSRGSTSEGSSTVSYMINENKLTYDGYDYCPPGVYYPTPQKCSTLGTAKKVVDIEGISGGISGGVVGAAFLNSTLYLVTAGLGYEEELYKLNISTGVATRVGDAEFFGLNSPQRTIYPSGLAALNGIFYMVGDSVLPGNIDQHSLYTIDVDTGVATFIEHPSNTPRISYPGGLAAFDSTLYMVNTNGEDSALYTLNTSDGTATLVGGLNEDQTLSEIVAGGSLAALNGTLYMSDGNLYTLNTSTGTATPVGNADCFGLGRCPFGSLVSVGDVLYMVTRLALYTLIYKE